MQRIATDLRRAGADAGYTSKQLDRLRDSQIRAARAAGDHSLALQLVDRELGRTVQGGTRYNQLLAQSATISKQAEGGARSFSSALGTLQQGLGALGLGLGAREFLQYGVSAFQAGQQLQQTTTTLRLLTRDQQLYNDTLALGRRNQSLFGGSLAENIQPLTALALQARKTGVDVAALNDIAQRLNVISPEQGLEGAGIALREALAGDTRSLVERFELPRRELAVLRDASLSAADRVKLLDGVLTSYGVTSEVVAGSVSREQQAVNRAAAAYDDLKVAIGQGAAPAVETLSTGVARLLGLINENPQAIAELQAVLGGRGTVTQADVDQAAKGVAQGRTERQLDQVARGTLQRSQTGSVSDFFGQTQIFNVGPARAAAEQARAALESVRPALDAINLGSDQARAQLDRLVLQLADGAITTPQFTIAVEQLAREVQGGGSAFDTYRAAATAARTATVEQTTALGEQIAKLQEAKASQEALNTAQATIAAVSEQVVNGYLSQEAALARIISLTGLARAEAEQFLGTQVAIAAQARAGQGLADQRAGERSGGAVRSQAEADAIARAARAQAERQRALSAAQREYAVSTASAADRLAILRRELSQLRQDTPDYYKKLTEVKQAEQAVAAERTRTGRAASSAASKEVKSAEEIRKARFDLLSNEEKLADLRRQVASGRLGEADRLEAIKQIRDLEEKITDEREKQAKSAIDARLAALDDRKQRRIEERELAAARRILTSGETSGEQKAAAQDAIARIELERQKRQLDIAERTRAAGGAAATVAIGGGAVSPPSATAALPGAVGGAVSGNGGGGGTGGAPSGGADITQQLLDAMSKIQLQAFIDGRPVAAQLIATLRGGVAGVQASGLGKV